MESAFLWLRIVFVPPFRKAKFCGVPSRASVTVGRAVDKKKKLRNTSLYTTSCNVRPLLTYVQYSIKFFF
jgi:hypothetical protein